jgi:hypothetical protein
MATKKLYFRSKKTAENVAKRRGKNYNVYSMPNHMYFVGTKSQADKHRANLTKGRTKTYSKREYKYDKAKKAKPAGRRKSKSGKTYYEYRKNRTDTSKKKKI